MNLGLIKKDNPLGLTQHFSIVSYTSEISSYIYLHCPSSFSNILSKNKIFVWAIAHGLEVRAFHDRVPHLISGTT